MTTEPSPGDKAAARRRRRREELRDRGLKAIVAIDERGEPFTVAALLRECNNKPSRSWLYPAPGKETTEQTELQKAIAAAQGKARPAAQPAQRIVHAQRHELELDREIIRGLRRELDQKDEKISALTRENLQLGGGKQ